MSKPNNNKLSQKRYQQSKNKPGNNKYFDFIGLAIVILLGIIIYSNSFDCPFQFDDMSNIVGNSKVHGLSNLKALWNYEHNRFIPDLTFAVNYHFGKLNVWGYHLFNLFIHLVNALLVWWLTILIFSSPAFRNNLIIKHKKYIGFIIALLFVSHPLATESITYTVQRIASIAALFYFLSVALYLKARLYDKTNYSKYFLFASSVISGIFALHSKENAYTLPFAILMVEVFFFQTKRFRIYFKDYRIILLLTAFLGFILVALFTFSFDIFKPLSPDEHNDYKTITSTNYLLTQFTIIPKYIQLLLLPINQNFDYDIPISNSFFEIKTILGFVFLSAIIVLGIFLYNKNRIISFGIFWFFLTMIVESSIIPISDLIYEHRTYLPSFGFFLIISSGIFMFLWDKYKNIAITLLLLIIVSNSCLTYSRNKIWKDGLTMWSDVISKSPNKARPYCNRATQYNIQNKLPEAIRDYKKAIELNPRWVVAYSNLGNVLTVLNDTAAALKYLDKAIQLDSNYSEAYEKRANLFTKENQFDRALPDFNKAIKLNPDNSDFYSNRGNMFTKKNKFDIASNDLNKSIALDPNNFQAYLNRGCLLNNQLKRKEALIDINKAIELDHNFAQAYYNRGIVYLNMDDKVNACLDFQKAASFGYQPAADFYKKYCQ